MAYVAYVDSAFYATMYPDSMPEEEMDTRLKTASRRIDTLTYNRIVSKGFSNLTAFQKDIIKEACCMQAKFEYDNADILESVLSGYSINGVSVQFGSGSGGMITNNGVVTSSEVYSFLEQTGLCCRMV